MAKAFVLINCEPGWDDHVVSKLRSIETVTSAYGIFGLYDVLAQLESDSEENLKNDIIEKIRKLEKILGTTTLMAESEKDTLTEIFVKKQENLDKNTAMAYVAIHSKKIDKYDILDNLSKIPGVIDGCIVVGHYEIICKVVAPTYNDIEEVVTKDIRKLEDIDSTVTLNVIPHAEL